MNMKISRFCLSAIVLSSACLPGCVTTYTSNGRQIAKPKDSGPSTFQKVTAPLVSAVRAVTPKDKTEPIAWQWNSSLPQEVVKADAMVTRVPGEAILAFANPKDNPVQLVSTHAPAPMNISALNNDKVRNLAELHTSVLAATAGEKKKAPVIEFTHDAPGSPSTPIEVAPESLESLELACLPDGSIVRVVEDGNPWVMIRDGAVRCKLMVREEQQTGLVHVVCAMKVCWGASVRLPVDITARYGSQELNCLGVNEVLERLYNPGTKKKQPEKALVRFAQRCEQDDYLIPLRYRELESKLAADTHLANRRPEPAFATVAGTSYPGPAVLGDARALSAFLMQPKVYSANEPEHVGWIVFDKQSIPTQEPFQLQIDLGSGPRTVTFKVPTSQE